MTSLCIYIFAGFLLSGQDYQEKHKGFVPRTNGAYFTDKYRNLFRENGHKKKEIRAKNEAAFRQLFHGDTSTTVYFEAGRNENGPLAYISDVFAS